MILSPQLAVAIDIDKVPTKASHYWMEPKLDGIRCVASWDGRMFSRSAKTDLGRKLPDIRQQVLDLQLPQGVWLDGEVGYLDQRDDLQWPILDFNKTTRVTGSGDGTARYKQMSDEEPIKFWVFDSFDEERPDLAQAARSRVLHVLFHVRTSEDRPGNLIVRVPSSSGWDEDVYNNYVLAGGEGVILKNPSAVYWPGKRYANTWFKVKKFATVDGVIEGYDTGQGKYAYMMGALKVRLANGILVKCSGMTDAVRDEMTKKWEAYQGKWCEIKYFGNVGLDAKGIRHPQFLRMRPDLD